MNDLYVPVSALALFLKQTKQRKMNDKDLEIILNDISSDINDVFILLRQKIEELENDLVELEKQHEQSLKVVFEEGYEEGVKYTDRLISDIISHFKNR